MNVAAFDLEPQPRSCDADDRPPISAMTVRAHQFGADRELMITDLQCGEPYLVDDAKDRRRRPMSAATMPRSANQVQQPLFLRRATDRSPTATAARRASVSSFQVNADGSNRRRHFWRLSLFQS